MHQNGTVTRSNTYKMPGWARKAGIRAGVVCAWILMVAMLMEPETSARAARRAMEQWYHAVAPALFPFMMLMPLITCREAAYVYEKLFGKLMQTLLGLPGCTAPAVIIGMMAGSPAGAAAAARIAENEGIGRGELFRIVICSCGLSPAFLISGIGMGWLNDANSGVLLLKCQVITQAIMLVCTRYMAKGDRIIHSNVFDEATGMGTAVSSVLNVAGYMVFFGVIADVVTAKLGNTGSMISCVLEVSTGASIISGINMDKTGKLIILSWICEFGGISICAQNLKILTKFGILPCRYIVWKGIQASASAIVMAAAVHLESVHGHYAMLNLPAIAVLGAVLLVIPAVLGVKRPIS